jgi:hypothetical protein
LNGSETASSDGSTNDYTENDHDHDSLLTGNTGRTIYSVKPHLPMPTETRMSIMTNDYFFSSSSRMPEHMIDASIKETLPSRKGAKRKFFNILPWETQHTGRNGVDDISRGDEADDEDEDGRYITRRRTAHGRDGEEMEDESEGSDVGEQ